MLNVFNKLVKYGSYKYTFLYETCIDTESIETTLFWDGPWSPRVALVKVLLYGTTYTPAVHRCTITTRHQRLNKITETVARLHLSRATCLARWTQVFHIIILSHILSFNCPPLSAGKPSRHVSRMQLLKGGDDRLSPHVQRAGDCRPNLQGL